jgi:malonyl-CoA O-methyltransferase
MNQPSDLGHSSERADRDRLAVQRQFDRRAAWPDPAAYLHREVAARMFERLDLVKLAPERVLDVGCGLAEDAKALAQRHPAAEVLGIDLSVRRLTRAAQALEDRRAEGWLQRLSLRLLGSEGRVQTRSSGVQLAVADAHHLPVASHGIDLIWSNLVLHWLDDVPGAIAEWYRVIRPGGLVMFSALGVDTLRELESIGLRLPRLPDMHDLGDALVHAGFADPVMDTERLTLSWRDPNTMLSELRALGGDVRPDRPGGLASPAAREALLLRLRRLCEPVPISITIELIQGHAWCPPAKRLPVGWSPVVLKARPSA